MADKLTKVRDLSDDELAAFHRMRRSVISHETWNRKRTKIHEAKRKLELVGFSIPENMYDFQTPVGWGEKTITVPHSRVRPDGFTSRLDGAKWVDELNDVVSSPFHQMIERRWVHSSMLHGVAFAFVVPGENADDEPIRYVKSATDATCERDPRTEVVSAALERLTPRTWILFLPGYMVEVGRVGGRWCAVSEDEVLPEGLVPCEPMPWAATTDQPMGRSRITRPLIGYMQQGVRTMLRQEANAEFYSSPQRALMGADEAHFTDENGEKISPLKALIGAIWALPDVWDEDEGKLVRPDLKQLQQATMTPHTDMLRSIASMVASETTIPLTYLGVVHDQPASAEAILAAESDMVAMLGSELPAVGVARSRFAAKIAAVQQNDYSSSMRRDLRLLRARFMDPGTPTLAARADAGQKFVSTFPDGDPEVAMEVYGLPVDQIERQLAYMRRQESAGLLDRVLASQGVGVASNAGSDAAEPGTSDAAVLEG